MNYVGNAPGRPGLMMVGDTIPVGSIIWRHSVPDGSYLQLNGQAVSKTTFPDLWAYAQGFLTADQVANPGLYKDVGSGNFAVPNLSGLFVRGTGQFDVNRAAAALGVRQDDGIGPHTHSYADTTATAGGVGIVSRTAGTAGGSQTSGPFPGTTDTRPINVALMPCVKALKTVIMPTQTFDLPGRLLQVVEHVRGDWATIACPSTPLDNTIPQFAEGAEIFTATIIPQRGGSRIRISADVTLVTTTGAQVVVGSLFSGVGPDALAVQYCVTAASDSEAKYTLGYNTVAPSTSPITFSLRFGGGSAASNVKIGGRGSAWFAGTIKNYLRVEEYNN